MRIPIQAINLLMAPVAPEPENTTASFSLAFNAGSHTNPPAWVGTHHERSRRYTAPPAGDQDIEYATANGTPEERRLTHNIGLVSDDEEQN